VIAFYGVTPEGNFRGRNVLPRPRTARRGSLVDEARPRPLRRAPPSRPTRTDTKIIAAWNGLAIAAVRARGRRARRARVRRAGARDGPLRPRPHAARRPPRPHGRGRQRPSSTTTRSWPRGLIDLHEATFDPAWLREAWPLHEVLARDFWDAEHGGFFQTSAADEVALARRKPGDDGALPSGNAVAAQNLLRLAELTGDDGCGSARMPRSAPSAPKSSECRARRRRCSRRSTSVPTARRRS
jgi:uncharacterized protein YyaL (SSP411 family)